MRDFLKWGLSSDAPYWVQAFIFTVLFILLGILFIAAAVKISPLIFLTPIAYLCWLVWQEYKRHLSK